MLVYVKYSLVKNVNLHIRQWEFDALLSAQIEIRFNTKTMLQICLMMLEQIGYPEQRAVFNDKLQCVSFLCLPLRMT